MKESIVLATSNIGKIKEFKALLPDKDCITQKELGINDAEETGSTFIENALIKARHASRISNMPAIADDSGLVVPALNGQPGIYSSRFAGAHASDQENIDHLLNLLDAASVLDASPSAFFYCAIVLIQHADDPTPIIGTGKLMGRIISTPKGTHGFGYSPIFYLPEHDCTLSELPTHIRNTLSHRYQALKAVSDQ
ncbi:MAG: RdgB/HAM1 family non-canonical purine NTP pyrophosphatase [Gammaproteobacteria bacterium]|nr:RdgB/HAM1 family non-canonical purine NTP pyrophosphatase [Gammaproteobacteria bacterium]